MKRRHKRIVFIVTSLAALGLAAWLVLGAFRNNLVFFFSPTQVVAKEAPVGRTFRIGGLVENGSLKRDSDGLTIRFVVTDTANTLPVVYKGILPDLFKEGRGCVAQGKVGTDGVFYADQIMAKHDENYMPPEAARALDQAKDMEKVKNSANEAGRTLSNK
jgi:cytochrome c-type biogenesis protein CcmE